MNRALRMWFEETTDDLIESPLEESEIEGDTTRLEVDG